MSLSGITFSGLATGLDTRAIINALMAVERRPILALQNKKKILSRAKSTFQDFQTKLEKLRDAAKAIRDSSSFLKFAASTDKDDYLKAEANDNATTGTYEIKVSSLAKGKVAASLGKADKDTTAYGTGTITFTFDEGGASEQILNIQIDGENSTLEDIANAINNDNDNGVNGVQATVMNTGNASTPYKLVLTSKKTGEVNDFAITTSIADPGIVNLVDEINNNTGEGHAASDAAFSVNGIDLVRTSNTISDAITGVTLTLTAADTNETTTLTISTDASGTSEKIKAFVSAYNDVVEFAKEQNIVNEDGEAKSPLFGDVTLRQIRSGLRSILGSSVDNGTGSGEYRLLSQIGVTSDTDGILTFNQGDFETALSEDETKVRDLFTFTGQGIALQTYNRIDALTDSVDGIFKARLDGYDSLIRRTDKNIADKERRLESFEEQQLKKFAALESLMAQLQSQGAAFSAFSASLYL